VHGDHLARERDEQGDATARRAGALGDLDQLANHVTPANLLLEDLAEVLAGVAIRHPEPVAQQLLGCPLGAGRVDPKARHSALAANHSHCWAPRNRQVVSSACTTRALRIASRNSAHRSARIALIRMIALSIDPFDAGIPNTSTTVWRTWSRESRNTPAAIAICASTLGPNPDEPADRVASVAV
jgi:hypothetical protein